MQFPVVLHHLSVAHYTWRKTAMVQALRYAQQFHERSPHDVRGLKLLAGTGTGGR
ncbi:MAG: hypothetical protein U5K56_18010 [Halioglobus sp.]|nr:hypothetical protein [Halioglobus sp.]